MYLPLPNIEYRSIDMRGKKATKTRRLRKYADSILRYVEPTLEGKLQAAVVVDDDVDEAEVRRLLSSIRLPETEEELKQAVMKIIIDGTDEKNMRLVEAMAVASRTRGFVRDPKIINGDVRASGASGEDRSQHSLSTMYFEAIRRSKGLTWNQCRKEWSPNISVGFHGWFCVGGKTIQISRPHANPHYSLHSKDHPPITSSIYSPVVWDDDSKYDDWTEGQCLCLQTRARSSCAGTGEGQRCIKYRYSIKNRLTDEVVVIGSTCAMHWGSQLANQATVSYKAVVRAVKSSSSSSAAIRGRKWCRR
jgi:hypothetical protein